jgi:flagellar biosynthetic protein FliQ
MTPDAVVSIGYQALQVALVVVSVLLLPALAVGLLVSMFQAATQINEMTLSFIPKLLVTGATLAIAGPWLLRILVDYTRHLIENIPGVIG